MYNVYTFSDSSTATVNFMSLCATIILSTCMYVCSLGSRASLLSTCVGFPAFQCLFPMPGKAGTEADTYACVSTSSIHTTHITVSMAILLSWNGMETRMIRMRTTTLLNNSTSSCKNKFNMTSYTSCTTTCTV